MNVPPELLTFFCCYNFLHNRVLIFSRHKFLLRLRTYGCIGLFVLSVFAVCTGGGWGWEGGGWHTINLSYRVSFPSKAP